MADTPVRTAAPPGLALRRITDADLPFLAEVYASTRREELAPVPWSEEQKAAFLRWQFDNQHQYYQQYYPTCEFLIIEKVNGVTSEPIGRLYIDRWKEEIRLVDVALLPEYRGAGHGGALLRSILAEGAASAAGGDDPRRVEQPRAVAVSPAGIRACGFERGVLPDEVGAVSRRAGLAGLKPRHPSPLRSPSAKREVQQARSARPTERTIGRAL